MGVDTRYVTIQSGYGTENTMATPLTNAERQKRWRDKRNVLAKQAEAGLAKGKLASLRNNQFIEQFCGNVGALVDGLITEGEQRPRNVLAKHGEQACSSAQAPGLSLRNGGELLSQRATAEEGAIAA